jgi:UDP-N-acetylmuramoyl-L-alanyl-D-glutamate--2,6-diaminopimelate ligase
MNAGATDAVMEVSSHALEQGRVWAIPYDVAVFTNLTRDHLDYHKDMESYFAAKSLLFQGTGARPPRVAVINADDPYGRLLLKSSHQSSERVIGYGIREGDFRATNIELQSTRTSFDLVMPSGSVRVQSQLLGRINVYNLLAASAANWARGCSLEQIAGAISGFNQVPGRFERVDCGQPFTVVVDYAHTNDALENLTNIARDFVSRSGRGGRVITVFGCGGDRDKTKRPLMGEAAGAGSDFVVVTSDNPRTEDPQKIVEDILPGLERSGLSQYTVELDRKKAIAMALEKARPGDMVLIAGKGHEKTQTTREGVFPFDDVQIVRKHLEQMATVGQRGGEQ